MVIRPAYWSRPGHIARLSYHQLSTVDKQKTRSAAVYFSIVSSGSPQSHRISLLLHWLEQITASNVQADHSRQCTSCTHWSEKQACHQVFSRFCDLNLLCPSLLIFDEASLLDAGDLEVRLAVDKFVGLAQIQSQSVEKAVLAHVRNFASLRSLHL